MSAQKAGLAKFRNFLYGTDEQSAEYEGARKSRVNIKSYFVEKLFKEAKDFITDFKDKRADENSVVFIEYFERLNALRSLGETEVEKELCGGIALAISKYVESLIEENGEADNLDNYVQGLFSDENIPL